MPPSLPFTYTRNAVCPHPLRQPPSLLINNLATHNSTIAYVRNTEVYVSNFGSNRLLQLPFRDAVQVFSITILPLSPSPVLCLGMLDGFQLWAVDSCRMVYFHALHPSDTDVCYACASTVLTESAFLVGDSTGAMHTFSAENGSGGSVNFKNKTSVRNHQATISGIARGDKVVASADQLGAVAIYDVNPNLVSEGISTNSLTIRSIVNITSFPISAIMSTSSYLLCALGNGKIVVLDLELNTIVEINGHSRSISGMDVDEASGVFCTVGEDSTLNVWTLPGEDDEVKLVVSDMVDDRLLTGCRFLVDGHDECKIVCSAYDHDQIIVWNRVAT